MASDKFEKIVSDGSYDSGYISNSLIYQETNSVEFSHGLSLEEEGNSPSNKTFQIKYKAPNENLLICNTEFSSTSTPYTSKNDIADKLENVKVVGLCTTPINRKRKTWNEAFEYDDDYCDNNRQKIILNCTRKLWNDVSDGSLSDTDLETSSSKKLCVEGSRSEPSSPQRNQLLASPHCKLGSLEKNEVLYPQLKYRARPRKYNISTPSDIRKKVKEQFDIETTPSISRPNQKLISFIRSSQKVDFFTLFSVKSFNFHIIEKVLFYLDSEDLVSVYNVSKTARNCIYQIPILNNIRRRYLHQKKTNKENVYCLSQRSKITDISDQSRSSSKCSSLNVSDNIAASIGSLNLSIGCSELKLSNVNISVNNNNVEKSITSIKTSPRKREWLKFVEASATLTPGQKLTRCSRCSNPAKVLNHIVICTRRGCQFICCSKCCDPLCLSVVYFENGGIENMLSTDGFINSIPPCSTLSNQGDQIFKKRLFLTDSSNSGNDSIPETLTHEFNNDERSANSNNNNNLDLNSESKFSSTFNLEFVNEKRSLPKTVNDLIEYKLNKGNNNRTSSNLLMVPESPPKVTKPVVISSKISKKNLRRL